MPNARKIGGPSGEHLHLYLAYLDLAWQANEEYTD